MAPGAARMTEGHRRRRSLRFRMTLGLALFALVLSATLLAHGFWVHEWVEQRAWQSLLRAERDVVVGSHRDDARLALPQSRSLRGWLLDGSGAGDLPPALAALPPGIHDEVWEAGGEQMLAVLVEDRPQGRLLLALDITELERLEVWQGAWLLASTLLATLLLSLMAWWLGGRLLRPLYRLSAQVDALQPAALGQRLAVPAQAAGEIASIAGALNAFLQRHDGFVERERAFVDSVGHELRTPIAVIAGAADVLGQRLGADPALRTPLRRIAQAAGGVEQLTRLLLVLAKEPARLQSAAEAFDLAEMLPDLVEDHRHLCADRALEVALGPLAPTCVQAPAAIVHVAIGNLLRNAIENSAGGVIRLDVEPAGVVNVRDPGSGLDAEEIGRLFAQRARRGDGHGAGLGLALIGRICDHLGWTLDFLPAEDGGTHARLDLRASLVPGPEGR